MTDHNDSGQGPKKDQKPGTSTIPPDQTLRLDREDFLRFQQEHSQKAPIRRGSLIVIAGIPADVGNHFVVTQAVVIGREQCALPLRDSRISRMHAQVECRGDEYYVKDLGSTNGTRLNGRPLKEEQRLQEGDKIVLGETVIKFTIVDDTEALYLRQMEQLVGTDSLTGLQAKHRFDAALAEALRSARLTRQPLSVMMMDMDGLKAINDAHGHHAGANTIRQVGKLIAQILKGRGDACRFGGDEFSAFLPGLRLATARAIAEQIRLQVEQTPLVQGEAQFRVSISIGIAELQAGIDTIEQLLGLADLALYRAKRKGRNQVSE